MSGKIVTVVYCESGRAISDFAVDKEIQQMVDHINALRMSLNLNDAGMPATEPVWKWHVSTDNFLTAVREAIAMGRIDCNDVNFEFEGNTCDLTDCGSYVSCLPGLEDMGVSRCENILSVAVKKLKQRRHQQ